ncbi:MAG: FtsW/RodA/SpoVE family cell cycle protein [Clostridiales bacterium]|nr:FtsW/RodA/SpoVE family cell cycle protein [Clostridiales bacterium]
MGSLRVHIKETDKLMLILCFITSAFGVLMVHSATRYHLSDGSIFFRDTIVMVAAIAIGAVAAIIISFIDYKIIVRFWPVIGGICLLLMLSLFIWGVGPADRPDAKTWIPIAGIYFQPSELLKIGFIITFSTHLDAIKDDINNIKNLLKLGVHALIPVCLVFATGDLGSALVFVFIILGLLFLAGLQLRYFAAGFAFSLAAVPIAWFEFLSQFQKERLLAVYYPKGMSVDRYEAVIFQQQQAVNAIGSGQLLGKGLFKGSYTQHGLVPVSENDMIFSVIGEELGFVGAMAALILITAIVVRIVIVGKKAVESHTSLMCYGVAIMIAAQSVINIGMCMKLLPVIGITLPFFSAGGSSNLCIYIAVGLVLSVHRFNTERKPVDFRLSRISTPFVS